MGSEMCIRDSREVFEEAAGISRFRHRKEEAERKLERTQENLVRITDKIDELELQVEPLRAQSEKAKKFLILRDELRGLEISLWLEQLERLRANAIKILSDYENAVRQKQAAQTAVERLYAAAEDYASQMREKDVQAEGVRFTMMQRQADANGLENAIAVLKTNIQNNLENTDRIRRELEAQQTVWRSGQHAGCVTAEDVAAVVSGWTGVPVTTLTEAESQRLLRLEEVLHQRLVGQEEAVRAVARAVRRGRVGLKEPGRPTGCFLFLGPTGVGKTELAKALAQALFDDEKAMVRIDMSEYMEKFSVSRLIGAPPGYVGYEEGGQLTEAVRRHPYSVVLFDEVEKAHPDVFNVLLQVLDDGRITDSQGRTVDFKNTIIILTSNLGSQYLLDGIDAGGEITEAARKAVTELLHHSFRPEFLNRLDEIVFYKPLTKENITRIIDLLTAELNGRLAEKQLTVTLTDSARRFIIDSAYDPAFGARPLRRFVQHTVETLISRRIIADEAAPGETLTVDCVDGQLTVSSHTVLRGEVVDA